MKIDTSRISLVLALLVLVPAAVTGQQCAQLVWADEFDGNALDTSKWSHQTGDGCPSLCGWGNNELEYYQEANAVVSGGTLKIVAREESVSGRSYTSARIRSVDKGDFTFGRVEARIKLPRGQGIWPAFWMLPTDEVYGGWPASGELDVMEHVGHEPSTVHGTIHYGDPWPNNSSQGSSYELHDGAFADGFHVFAVEREPGLVRWLVDDVVYATRRAADLGEHTWPFDERFHVLLNLAVGGDWPGRPDATTVFPQRLEVDYVRVWDGGRPFLQGTRRVLRGEFGTVYEIVHQDPGTRVTWTLPAGARIVAGEGTRKITVNWGREGGDVVAEVRSACGRTEYRIRVALDEPEVSLTMPNQLALEALGPSRLLATWNDRSDDETAFELIGKGPDGFQKVASAGADATLAVSLPLTPGTRYEVRVRARDGARVSAWSPKRVLTLPEELPRPRQFKGTPLSPSELRLDWVDTSRDEESFEIDLRPIPELWEPAAIVGANVESVVLTGLTPGQAYMFRLRARRQGGLSEWRRTVVTMPSE